jgi:CMD domain protein
MTSATTPTTEPLASGPPDIVDHLAGIAPDSRLAQLRAQRPDVMRHAQGSYLALLEPDEPAGLGREEREAVALRVAVLTKSPALADWHRERLRRLGASDAAIAAVEHFPDGSPLSARRAAILRHVDRVTRELGSGTREHIEELTAAGLGPREVVTLSQLIAFLSFQVRLLAGLRLLAEDV